jgi:N-acetylglucosaminyl-diphospho-decaprenol L-rhamnosyltransferase
VTAPVVDVVILTWNDGPLLARAIASVEDATGVQPHLIVVDNASVPPAESRTQLPTTWIRNPANAGVAPARNQGVQAGSADLVCLLDSDAELQPGSLERMVGLLRSDASVGLVAPVFTAQSADASAGRAPGLLRKALRVTGLSSRYAAAAPWTDGHRDVDFAIGACQVFRRDAFESIGGLDETYFYGPEDVDFCLRIRLAGWRIVQLDVPVVHPPRRRNRAVLTKRGIAHARAVTRHLWRHRGTRRRLARA